MPKQKLVVFRSFVPAPGWKWESRGGPIAPSKMDGHHLFHTLRMIWNHTVEESCMRVGNVRLYRFDPRIYTVKYMRQAVYHIGRELMGRLDELTEQMRDELWEMEWWLTQFNWSEVDQKALPPSPVLKSGESFHDYDRRMLTYMERGPSFVTGKHPDDPYYKPDEED